MTPRAIWLGKGTGLTRKALLGGRGVWGSDNPRFRRKISWSGGWRGSSFNLGGQSWKGSQAATIDHQDQKGGNILCRNGTRGCMNRIRNNSMAKRIAPARDKGG